MGAGTGSSDGKIDVAGLMGELREAIERRREAALQDGTPVEEVVTHRLEAIAAEIDLDDEMLLGLRRGDPRWNLSPEYRITTHRKGLVAVAVVGLKRLVSPLVRLYTDPIVERQRQINRYLLQVVRALFEETTRLQQAVAKLKER